MIALRRILCAAVCAGLLSGVLVAIAHEFSTVPLILKAETYEDAANRSITSSGALAAAARHEPAAAARAPESGIERAFYTMAADILSAIGFALLLTAGIAIRGAAAGWREGLFWGLAGFATFSLAPGVGLPPELPGSEAAALTARQLWWLFTAAATGGGLALLCFGKRPFSAGLAIVLIVLPHLYGAPAPPGSAAAVSKVPEGLAHRFAVLATLISFAFWAALGASTGYFYRRFGSLQG